MKNRNAGFGVFLVVIGIIWVLINLRIINLSIFDSLQVLWPLVLVVIGVTVIFKENTLVKTVAWLLFLAAIIFYGSTAGNKSALKNETEGKRITIEKHEETKFGELKLLLGGVNLNFDSKTQNLLEADIDVIDTSDLKYASSYRNGKETAVIKITRDPKITLRRVSNNSKAEFHLHQDVIWDMDIKAGAVSGTIDMSQLKVRNSDIDAGASSLKLICGNNYEEAEIKINAGASNINLIVPEAAGIRIKIDGLVSKESLDNLGWKKQDKYYFSPDYFNSKNKININIKMGVGKLSVDYY